MTKPHTRRIPAPAPPKHRVEDGKCFPTRRAQRDEKVPFASALNILI